MPPVCGYEVRAEFDHLGFRKKLRPINVIRQPDAPRWQARGSDRDVARATDPPRREGSIARTLEASRALDVAVVEIGGWGLGGTQVLDQLPVADRQATID